ncbi:PLP-dependent aspartate aminotransferase family protein [Telmatospirillum sp.]|uniref:trans-sulfuration enzyme family protein n=1 Tax=Telmatospirillum sp. TaxID=2079197 RepID=UPI002846C2AF|nr:PLP-dependent aspartate aminotransferase family protein [Telmatospirillum sp.]MDR3436016.1 PLP-dependent aspartate aminotransferase family protein [Telmatospirillum sp.]
MNKIAKKTAEHPQGLATRAIHGRQSHDPSTGAVIPPIYATSTFAQSSPGVHTGWEYARSQNPTRAAFEASLAELESGAAGYAFASGLAAEAAILDLLEHGSHIVASDDLYGGTWRLFHRVRANSANLAVTHVDFSDIAAIEAAITPRTALLWVETPSNPLLKLADLSAIAGLGKKHHVLTVADNTFASPAVQRPLEHGFDLVVHSVTKYIGGHSDIIGGAVVVGDDTDLQSRIAFVQNSTGGILDPFSSFLGLRGVKTLPLRVERHSANALAVAGWLETHQAVERVLYPGLPSHPQHDLALRQMKGGGGMVSVFLKATAKQTAKVLEHVKIFTLAESLGGVESLAGHPVTMSHGSIPEDRRKALGITPNLIRLSVGLEDAEDLIADLDQALARI